MRQTRPRGAALGIGILVSVLIAGLILTMAWSAAIQSQTTRNTIRANESFYAAEAGAQLAMWRFKHDNTWRAGSTPLTGNFTVNGDVYQYNVTCSDNVAAANLIWKFDEGSGPTTADSSGNGNTGTLEGGCVWVPGRSGTAIQFNGTTSYVDCGNSATTNLLGSVSMSAWVKLNGAAYDQKIGANQNGFFGGYKLCIYNSKVEFEVRDASNVAHLNRNIAGGTVMTVGTWYHVVGVYDDVNHIITTYVDGQLDRQMTGVPANALGSTTGSFIIGREPFDATLYFFNGIIDEVRVYNRVLTPTEIKSLFDTTVNISSTVTGNGTGNYVTMQASIPTPAAPVPPAVCTGASLSLNNVTVLGDLQTTGNLTTTGNASTVNGNILYGGTYTPGSLLTVNGSTPPEKGSVSVPVISYASLQSQANQTYASSQSGTQFAFNNLGGNKIIYVNGNVTNPTFYIGGVYPSGGTLVVNGNISFGDNAAAVGQSGFPINLVATGSITTGSNFNLIGGLYAGTSWTRKSATIQGPIVVNGAITDSAGVASSFSTGPFPFFDPRIVQTASSLPMYISGFHGTTP